MNDNKPELIEEFIDSPGYLFIQTAKLIRKNVEKALKPLSLIPQEYGILKVLATKGSIAQHKLSQLFFLDKTRITELCYHLEDRDLIYKETNKVDHREKWIFLTPKGKSVLARATRIVNKEHKKFLAPVSETEWSRTKEIIVKLLENQT